MWRYIPYGMAMTIDTTKIREAMDAIGARDIAQIRASTITGGPACADCGHCTVHGHRVMGAWHCRDTETCNARILVASGKAA